MKRLLLIFSLLLSVATAENIHLRVTAASHASEIVKGPQSAQSETTCRPGLIGDRVNCSTNTTTDERSKLEVENIVEARGRRYTIRCTGYWVGTNCAPMTDGDEFEADYDGKTTMWVAARKGGNLGKEVRIKYRVTDVRDIPEGHVTATSINAALRAAAQRHPDLSRYDQAMDRIAKKIPPGAMQLDDYIEMLYQRAKAADHPAAQASDSDVKF